jgi:hypothetical protein
MSPTKPRPKRIRVVLPALTDEQATLLHDLCAEVTESLWHVHGDFLSDLCARRADDGHADRAPAAHDDSDIDF